MTLQSCTVTSPNLAKIFDLPAFGVGEKLVFRDAERRNPNGPHLEKVDYDVVEFSDEQYFRLNNHLRYSISKSEFLSMVSDICLYEDSQFIDSPPRQERLMRYESQPSSFVHYNYKAKSILIVKVGATISGETEGFNIIADFSNVQDAQVFAINFLKVVYLTLERPDFYWRAWIEGRIKTIFGD